MRIIKRADKNVEQTRRDTQATAHGMSLKRLNALTKDITGLSCDRKDWDIQISGESPNKRSKRA